MALAAVLLAPISASAEDLTSPEALDAAKAETLRLAALGSGTDGVDATLSSDAAPAWWPWKTGELEKPPEVKPYQMPTLAGDGLDYHDRPAAIVQAPALDADAIFKAVLACYPERSKFDIDVDLRASIRSSEVLDLQDTTTGLGKSYVGIVASMPLYSGKELDREKEREYSRRKDTAKAVADFIAAIAGRNHAIRELALYRSLEARSAIRVKEGVTEASEQVGYLEKVANSQEKLIEEEARIMESRLLLSGMCDPRNAKQIGGWLKKISAVPKVDE
ncbi:hypothetical protein [Thiothrix nivea]|uniref:hypothetical protein n=1 Tax=Thiothrix nivea TaxID=1031 RepID=UPI00067FC060|nr:hypothetical protein [Thiothrix nivea]